MTEFDKHELVDRTSMISLMFEAFITDKSSAFEKEIPSVVLELIDKISNDLGELYVKLGEV